MGPPSTALVLWCPGGERKLARRLIGASVTRLLDVHGPAVRVVNHCRSCGSTRHGRPVLAPVSGRPVPHLSIGRTDDLTVVALTGAGPVGVDVERSDAASFAGFDLVGTHPLEQPRDSHERSVLWVRKESLLKATGHGLALDPTRIRITDAQAPPAVLAWETDGAPEASVWMSDLELGGGYVAAVTVLAAERPGVVVRRAAPEDLRATASP